MDKREILAIVRSSPENKEPLPQPMFELLVNLGIIRLSIGDDDPSILMYRMDVQDIEANDINPDFLYDKGWLVSDDEEYIYKIIE